jgi:hypothetical protein
MKAGQIIGVETAERKPFFTGVLEGEPRIGDGSDLVPDIRETGRGMTSKTQPFFSRLFFL